MWTTIWGANPPQHKLAAVALALSLVAVWWFSTGRAADQALGHDYGAWTGRETAAVKKAFEDGRTQGMSEKAEEIEKARKLRVAFEHSVLWGLNTMPASLLVMVLLQEAMPQEFSMEWLQVGSLVLAVAVVTQIIPRYRTQPGLQRGVIVALNIALGAATVFMIQKCSLHRIDVRVLRADLVSNRKENLLLFAPLCILPAFVVQILRSALVDGVRSFGLALQFVTTLIVTVGVWCAIFCKRWQKVQSDADEQSAATAEMATKTEELGRKLADAQRDGRERERRLKERNTTLENDLVNANARAETLQRDLSRANDDKDALQLRVDDQDRAIADLEAVKDRSFDSNKRLTEEIGRKDEELQRTKTACDEANEALKAKTEENSTMQEELSDQRTKSEGLEQQVVDKVNEMEKLQKLYDNLMDTNVRLEKERDTAVEEKRASDEALDAQKTAKETAEKSLVEANGKYENEKKRSQQLLRTVVLYDQGVWKDILQTLNPDKAKAGQIFSCANTVHSQLGQLNSSLTKFVNEVRRNTGQKESELSTLSGNVQEWLDYVASLKVESDKCEANPNKQIWKQAYVGSRP